ncbi:hypothetical protein AB0M10_29125 [Streptomyces sp. NPDC051840]|uniref:hypothetical protein n=1 Tax=Streptomyces sp. NPDC051840 TaxID=3154752 RepID=UPI0034267363
MTRLTADEYRTLIVRALEDAVDANTTEPDLRRLFTPSSHRLALAPDVTVVKGARGTGKTYWAKALTDPRLREIAAASYLMPRLRRVEIAIGFAADRTADAAYPTKRVIARLTRDDDFDPVDFWFMIVLMALRVPEIAAISGWSERMSWVRENPEALDDALQEADDAARSAGTTRVLLFDALDHLHRDRTQADKLVSGLLEVALELRLTTSALRAKVFIRPDMYDSAPKKFADASKLTANTAELTWLRENLYGLFFHQLGNYDGPGAAEFRATTGSWRDEGGGRFIAPTDVIADQTRQEAVFGDIAGPYMGTDRRKGLTYTWVPNHLQDGKEEVSPRTWLYSLREAAADSAERYAGHEFALHYDAIRASLHGAARIRVEELTEDIAWAVAAVGKLEGGEVPMEPSVVIAHWNQGGLSAALQELVKDGGQDGQEDDGGSGPRKPDDLFAVLEELIDIGVLTRRLTTGAIDLPDVYRLHFNIGRRGGVSRKKS